MALVTVELPNRILHINESNIVSLHEVYGENNETNYICEMKGVSDNIVLTEEQFVALGGTPKNNVLE